ncbi:unnamed protein product, partial [Trichobilharzia regenti]
PTVSPSELASYSTSLNPDIIKPKHDFLDGINVEVNHAYEPADFHTSTPQSNHPTNRNTSPLNYESTKPSGILPSPTLSANSTTMTSDPSSLKLSSMTTTAISNKKSPYSTAVSTTFPSTVNGNLDPAYSSPNHTNNLSASSTHSSLSMPTSASTRVHFSGSVKPDESVSISDFYLQ